MKHIYNLDELLSSDDTTKSIIELDNFICKLCEYGENLNILSEPQRNFYFNQNLEKEINNGGFDQYFINSSGENADETVKSLKLIGANHTAELLQKAIDQFPGKTVPKDWDNRNEQVRKIEKTAMAIWEVLDQAFYEYVDDLNTLNIEYVRLNKEYF